MSDFEEHCYRASKFIKAARENDFETLVTFPYIYYREIESGNTALHIAILNNK